MENLSQRMSDIFDSGQTDISYELPYHIARYETNVRSFRASLPQSEYSPEDQRYFRAQFTDLISQASGAITNAQLFHVHVVGTINIYVSDTRYMIQKLNRSGLLSPSQTSSNVNGPLALGMTWLNDHRVVYLPAGIGPFQELSTRDSGIQAIQIMEHHVASIAKRLTVNIDLAIVLQRSLWQLGEISELIANRVSECQSSNKFEAVARGRRLQLADKIFGPDATGYQIGQRRKSLTAMGPVFQDAMSFLSRAAYQLQTAQMACQALIERLQYEGRAVQHEAGVPEWVVQQANELDTGIADLEIQLKAFRLKQLQFDKRLFHKDVSGGIEDK